MRCVLTFTSCVLKEGVISQTLSGYLRSDTCFSSCLSLLLRTLSALSVLPSLVARTCQAYLFSRCYLS